MSLPFTVFPAVDILGGRCVQLRRGDPEASTIYYDDPVEAARRWQDDGATALHVVDLDAALGRGDNRAAVARVVLSVGLPVQAAGGVRTAEDVEALLAIGAERVVVGTVAATDPDLLVALAAAHGDAIVVAADVRAGEVVVKGWTEGSGLRIDAFVRTLPPIGGVLVTDVARDGLLQGPAVDLYRELVGLTEVPVIASGGVHDAADVDALRTLGCAGVVVGTALYEGTLHL